VVEVRDPDVLDNDVGLAVDPQSDSLETRVAANAADGLVAVNLETGLGARLVVGSAVEGSEKAKNGAMSYLCEMEGRRVCH